MHPYLLHSGNLFLPTFGVLAAVGLMCALGLSERTARLAGVSPDRLWDAGLFAVLMAFVASRLLLVLQHWGSFRAYPVLLLTVPSLTAPGLLLTLAATLAWLWWKQIPVLQALDAWAPCGTLVWFFLALGHFAEGSDPGMATALPIGVSLPGDAMPLQPVALYAAGVALLITLGLWLRLRAGSRVGETAGLGLVGVGVGQFLLSFVRQPGLEWRGLEVLQWVSLGMVVAGGVLVALSLAAGRGSAVEA